jgi:hypothetical protein
MTIYRHMIGLLMYLKNMKASICFVVNTLSQYMVESRSVHLVATKHVMRYLKGTIDYGLRYASYCEIILQDLLIQIGPVVLQTGRVHLDVSSVWNQP